MKIFIDSAIPAEVKKFADLGAIDGVTTNPSLVTKTGLAYADAVQQVLAAIDGPVSLEVLGTTYDEMLREGRALAAIHKNVVVKIPMLPEGMKVVKALVAEGIKVNVTLVFSCEQALLAAKAGADYVSPFLGRIEDTGDDSFPLLQEIRTIYDNYDFKSQILAASMRSPRMVALAALAGAEIATVPAEVLEKMYKHPLTDVGLEKFLEDFKNSGLQPLV